VYFIVFVAFTQTEIPALPDAWMEAIAAVAAILVVIAVEFLVWQPHRFRTDGASALHTAGTNCCTKQIAAT
jgi:hypothetical protein